VGLMEGGDARSGMVLVRDPDISPPAPAPHVRRGAALLARAPGGAGRHVEAMTSVSAFQPVPGPFDILSPSREERPVSLRPSPSRLFKGLMSVFRWV